MSFRLTLRDRAVAALIAAGTPAEDRVYAGRVDPAAEAELPLYAVSAAGEQKSAQGLAADNLQFRAVLSLEIHARAADPDLTTCEDALEDLIDAAQECLLASADFLAAPLLNIEAVVIDKAIDGAGEIYIGEATIRLDIVYLDQYEVAAT